MQGQSHVAASVLKFPTNTNQNLLGNLQRELYRKGLSWLQFSKGSLGEQLKDKKVQETHKFSV